MVPILRMELKVAIKQTTIQQMVLDQQMELQIIQMVRDQQMELQILQMEQVLKIVQTKRLQPIIALISQQTFSLAHVRLNSVDFANL